MPRLLPGLEQTAPAVEQGLALFRQLQAVLMLWIPGIQLLKVLHQLRQHGQQLLLLHIFVEGLIVAEALDLPSQPPLGQGDPLLLLLRVPRIAEHDLIGVRPRAPGQQGHKLFHGLPHFLSPGSVSSGAHKRVMIL